MAKNHQKTGVNAMTIGENQPVIVEATLQKDEIVEIKNQQEQFIPVQQILNK